MVERIGRRVPVIDALRHIPAGLTQAARSRIFGGNAPRWYQLTVPPSG